MFFIPQSRFGLILMTGVVISTVLTIGVSTYRFSTSVTAVPISDVCGNGYMEGLEQCDDGNLLNNDGCSNQCLIEIPAAICGNGVLEAEEQCDDGNVLNGDGCSDQCVIVEVPPVVVDDDNDGVLNESDVCPDTKVENIALNPNQYAQNNSTLAFEVGPKNDQSVVFTMADTKGCSCEQIAKELGIGEGHIKKGCSLGIMERWTGIKVKGSAR